MSTKVLQGAAGNDAEILVWRPALSPDQFAGQSVEPARQTEYPPRVPLPAEERTDRSGGSFSRSGESSGAGSEESRAIESKFRQLEARLPEVERLARAEGRKEGETAALAQWSAAIEKAARSVDQITSLRGRLRKEAEQDVVQLSLSIARRVLRRELTMDPEALLGLVRTAFERVEMREVHRVRVRPQDSEVISQHLARIGGPQKVEVLGDIGLDAGSVIVETARGNLDASLETQLAEIERGFADLLIRRKDCEQESIR